MAATLRLGAAIFNADHARLAEEVRRVEEAGMDFLHFDVFDDSLIPGFGFPPKTLKDIRSWTRLPVQVHLGVDNPRRVVPKLVDSGADLVLVHYESLSMPYEQLLALGDAGIEIGLAVALGTPISSLEPLIGRVHTVLLLTRAAGEDVGESGFEEASLPRIGQTARLAAENGTRLDLQVAGGIKRTHIARLLDVGVGAVILGRALFKAGKMEEEVSAIRSLSADRSKGRLHD